MKPPQPVFEEVTTLPAVDKGVVHEDQIDVNGHMNVTCYFDILTSGTITACGEYGLDLSYPAAQGMGLFAVDHRAQYLGELRLGAAYSVHVRLLDASERAVHTMAYLVDLHARRISSTLESLLLNVNLQTRRVDRFTDATITALTTGLTRDQSLTWAAHPSDTIRVPERALAG